MDLTIISLLAVNGVLMTSISVKIVGGVLVAAIAFAFVLDAVKWVLYRHLEIA